MTQSEALDILKLGYNIFLTGPAGSGKTFLLNKYIEYLNQQNIKVGITASTGIASTHLNGRTIHSWSGFGIKDELSNQDMRKLLYSPQFKKRILSTKVLIIDEVSMLHAHQLDLVNKICRKVRYNPAPFGGLQVVLSGDFFQLRPVTRGGKETYFVSSSDAWSEMGINVCYLGDCQYRQKDDNFIKLLNEIRKNSVSPANKKMLFDRKDSVTKHFIKPAKLLTHNNDVDAINSFELAKIKGKQKNYSMTSTGNEKLVNSLKNGCLAPEKLVLKKKAIVMFVKNNFEKGYVNGTMGEVTGFSTDGYPIVETILGKRITARPLSWELKEDENELAQITQIPLRLAWAITIHKCQGMTLDMAEIDLSRAFDYGMGYVALSRVRSFSGIKLLGINDLSLQVSEDAIELDKSLRKLSKKTEKNLEKMGTKEKREMQEDFVIQSADKSEIDDEDDEDEGNDRIEYIDIEEIPF